MPNFLFGIPITVLRLPPITAALAGQIYEAVRKTEGKAEFALDLLTITKDLARVRIPKYIADGLRWLELQLVQNQQQVLQPAAPSVTPLATASTAAPAPNTSAAK